MCLWPEAKQTKILSPCTYNIYRDIDKHEMKSLGFAMGGAGLLVRLYASRFVDPFRISTHTPQTSAEIQELSV